MSECVSARWKTPRKNLPCADLCRHYVNTVAKAYPRLILCSWLERNWIQWTENSRFDDITQFIRLKLYFRNFKIPWWMTRKYGWETFKPNVPLVKEENMPSLSSEQAEAKLGKKSALVICSRHIPIGSFAHSKWRRFPWFNFFTGIKFSPFVLDTWKNDKQEIKIRHQKVPQAAPQATWRTVLLGGMGVRGEVQANSCFWESYKFL